jgi:DNA helicase-2/ATP-dependent DNA helicase PcrA
LKKLKKLASLIKEKTSIKILDREDIIYNKGEIVIPAYFAKGLEFDAVIIVNSEADEELKEDKLKYVMATRALHQLYVYNIK